MVGQRSLLIRGAGWIAMSRAVVNLTSFASTILLARLLLPEDFGIVAIAASVAAIIGSISELSLSQALIQHERPEDKHYDAAWTLNVIRALVLAGLIAGLAWPVAAAYGEPRLAPLLFVIAGATLVSGLENPKLVVFQRELVFRQEFVVNVVSKLAGFAAALGVALVYRSYWALVVGSVASQLSRLVLSYLLIRYRPRPSLAGCRELLNFSVWLTLSRAVQTLNWRSDPLAIGFFISPTALGYYSMGGNLASMPVREGLGPVRQILFPAYARMHTDPHRLRAAYVRAQAVLCMLAFPIGAGFAALAEPAVRLLIGEKWLPAVPIIQALTLVAAFQAVEGSQPLAMAVGRTRDIYLRELRVLFVRVPLMLGGLWIGQQTMVGAIMGVIYGRALASTLNVVWNMQLVRSILSVTLAEQFLVGLRPAVAAGVMFFTVASLHAALPAAQNNALDVLRLLALTSVGAATYASILGLAWLAQGRPEGAETEVAGLLWRKALTLRKLRE